MNGPTIRQTAGAPPWLWFWAVMFIINLPVSLQFRLQTVSQGIDGIQRYASPFRFLLYPSALLDLLALAALTLGLLLVLFPRARAAYLEKKFSLKAPPLLPTLAQISEFVGAHAPGLLIKANLLRANQLAFVYPSGYRKAALALFGGMVRLWQTDRKAAEAVLLHEIAHYRRGDMLIVGMGSFLETLVRYALPCYLVLFLLPSILVNFDEHRRFLSGLEESDRLIRELEAITGARTASSGPLERIEFYAKGYGWITAGYLFQLLAPLVLLLAGIWSAELNADRYARERQGESDAIRRALDSLSGKAEWWHWLLLHLSHPPVMLRRRFLNYRAQRALFWLLMAFPLGHFILLAARHAHAITAYIAAGMASQLWSAGLANTRLFFVSYARSWFIISAILLLWPFLWSLWESLFTRERRAWGHSNYYGTYMLCSAATALVGALGCWLGS